MKQEVQSAVDFLTKLLGKRIVESDKVSQFHDSLENVLCSHYEDHWFPEKPFKGSAYRCMRIVNRKMDPLISKAGANVGLTESDLLNFLPSELTLWIDPEEVSYRIGEDGSIGVLFCIESTSQNQSQSSDSESDSSSGSLSSSPSQSQEYLSFQQPVCQDQSRFDFPQSSLATYYQSQADPMAHHWGDYFATFVAS